MEYDNKFSLLFEKIDELFTQNERCICAIEGGAASGKTTLAAEIKKKYDCNIFSMDEFFLQPFQRTAKRLAEPGGNVDYERFLSEVLAPLATGKQFTYRPYDCSASALGAEVSVAPRQLNIVEGVYSTHPFFPDIYNLKIFLEIDEQEQKKRLLARDQEKYERFINEWIPLENKYFETFQAAANCDMILRN